MSEKVNHVGLAVADLDAEVDFWTGALDFERVGALDADDDSSGQLVELLVGFETPTTDLGE